MNGVSPVTFGGKSLYQPGYYGQRNLSGADTGAANGSRLLIIGECKGGIPYNAISDFPNAEDRINWVSNTDDLNNILRDGNAYYAALFALTPTTQPGVSGAPSVGVIRINQATRSSKTVTDGTNPVIDLKSFDYGLYTNQIRRKISAGTIAGKKISVKLEAKTIEQDNITNELFSIRYTGLGTACILTLDPVGLLTTSCTGAPADNLSIDLTTFDTVANLVAAIATNAKYSVSLVGDGGFKVNKLDKVKVGDAVDILPASYTVKAILQACIDWFNNSSLLIVAAIAAGLVERRIPANDTDYVFLTGGVDGATPVQQDWQDALDQVCGVVDAFLIGVATDNAAVQAAVSAHCTAMSDVAGRQERLSYMGSSASASKSDKKTAAQNLNNAIVGYAGTEIKRYDKNGILTLWPGWALGAEILGMASGNPVTFAPTNKMINASAVKELYSNSDKDAFIQNGVTIAAPSNLGGIRVVRSISTYQGSNIIANEWSAMRTALFVTKDHRAYVESLIGQPGDATALESIRNRALMRLDYYVEQGYFVVDPQFGNAYRNFVFKVVGDTVTITYEATLVIPVNFILVTHNFTVIGVKK